MLRALRIAALLVLAGCTTEFDPSLLDGERDGGPRDAEPRDAEPRDASDGGGDGSIDGGPDGGPPVCPAVLLVEGTDIVAPPPAGPRPERGEVFRDPSFGTCISRISDGPSDGFGGHVDGVSRGTLDSAGRYAVPLTGSYQHHLYDVEARSHISPLTLYSGNRARLAAQDEGTLFWLDEAFTITQWTLGGSERDRVDLTTAVRASLSDATRLDVHPRSTSADDSRWALTVTTADGRDRAVVTVEMPSGTVLGARRLTDVPAEPPRIRVGISPSGEYVAVALSQEEVGPMHSLDIYTADLTRHVFGRGATDQLGAWDFARDAAGDDVLVYTRDHELVAVDLAATTPSPRVVMELGPGPAVPNRRRSLVVLSGAAYDRPGWLVLSFAICRDTSGVDCPPGSLWAQDKIALVSLGTPARVLNLAWHRSRLGGSRHPRALPNRDLTRILFESTWAGDGTEPAELYAIELPPDAIGAP